MTDFWELFASFTEELIAVRLYNALLGFRDRRHMRLKSAVFLAVITAENILFTRHAGNGTVSAGYEMLFAVSLAATALGYAVLVLGGKMYEKILVSSIPTVVILPINLLILNVISVVTGDSVMEAACSSGRTRVYMLVFSKLAFFLVCEVFIYMRRRGGHSHSVFQWFIQFSCFATTFLISYLLLNFTIGNTDAVLYFFASVMIAALNILLFIVMNRMQRSSAIKEEYEIAKVSLAAQERFVDEARERYMEMRTLRHDMRHCLMTAAELISSGRAADAKEYLEKVADEKVSRAADGINTGSVVIDAVINSKIAVCLKNNIEVKSMIDSRIKDIHEMEAGILLSNVLDNAIRGCGGARQPRIELIMGTRKAFTYIIVKNSIASSVLSKNPGLETDKEDRAAHGFGITSMQKIAEKYGGSVEFREEGSTFITEIWLEGARPE